MENKDKIIEELFARIEQLTRQQKLFHDEIYRLHEDLHKLKDSRKKETPLSEEVPLPPLPAQKAERFLRTQTPSEPSSVPPPASVQRTSRNAWEDFIGTNLLNKIGIAVLVLGVGFGTKYSIDNQLIDPLTRIVLGYLTGIALTGIALRLRASHPGFSAVLLSGGMAVFYFITYAAHSFYGLIPQAPAFILMVLFTVFTIIASLKYDLEVISIIALVGAYAVPLLLSDGSGRVVILFSYMTIINSGILALAFKRSWKRLYYLAFILTWLTFASWYAFSFDNDQHTAVSLIFSSIFFLTFYVTFLAYKLVRGEALERGDVICMLINSFIAYGYGYLTIESLPQGEQYLGMFTLIMAVVHFVICVIIYRAQKGLSDIFYFVAGMVLVFLTIAVPVQLEGNWVTVVWAAEAALMFWIGRTKSFPTYEKLGYPLIALALISLVHDWSTYYPNFYGYAFEGNVDSTIFLNVQFLTSMLVGGLLVFIFRVDRLHRGQNVFRPGSALPSLIGQALPVAAIIVLYIGFYKEIEAYWNNLFSASRVSIRDPDGVSYDQYNYALLNFKKIWLIIFSALFAIALSLVARYKWRSGRMAYACVLINCLVLLVFIASGLLALSALRTSFLDQELSQYYGRGYGFVMIRYLAIFTMLPLLLFNKDLARQEFFRKDMRNSAQLFFHFVVLALLSSELIHWLDMARVENSFKLSLSILWGIYALFLIVYGLARDQKHIRMGGIVLFGVTLLKLFVYDMDGMSTILKTVVMIVLGALLLTASYIYNRFKRSASNEAP